MTEAQGIFVDGRWYNTTEAYKKMQAEGSKMSRTTFWRRVSAGDVKWKLRRNFPGKWFRGRDLNQFYNSTCGV